MVLQQQQLLLLPGGACPLWGKAIDGELSISAWPERDQTPNGHLPPLLLESAKGWISFRRKKTFLGPVLLVFFITLKLLTTTYNLNLSQSSKSALVDSFKALLFLSHQFWFGYATYYHSINYKSAIPLILLIGCSFWNM